MLTKTDRSYERSVIYGTHGVIRSTQALPPLMKARCAAISRHDIVFLGAPWLLLSPLCAQSSNPFSLQQTCYGLICVPICTNVVYGGKEGFIWGVC